MGDPIPKKLGFISSAKYKGKTRYYIQKFPLRYLHDGSIEYYKGSGFDSKEDAIRYRTALVEQRARGEFSAYNSDFYQVCLSIIDKKDLLDVNRHRYKVTLRSNKDKLNSLRISDLNIDNIEDLLHNAVDKHNLTRLVCTSLTYLFRRGEIKQDLCHLIRKPKVVSTPKRPLTRDELKDYLDRIKGMKYEHVARLMFFTGMRVGEALGLQWKDIVFDSDDCGHVKIYKSYSKGVNHFEIRKPKTPSSIRTVYFKDKCLVNLLREKAQGKSQEEYIASSPRGIFTTHRFNELYFVNIGKAMGIRLTSHYARVTYTSYALDSGLIDTTIQQQLGHTDTTLIHKVYGKMVGDLQTKLQVDIYNCQQENIATDSKVIYHNFKRTKTS